MQESVFIGGPKSCMTVTYEHRSAVSGGGGGNKSWRM